MMTEDEARKKWCPFARVTDEGNGNQGLTATNRHWGGKKNGPKEKQKKLRGNSFCIADECSAWRWSQYQQMFKYATPVSEEGKGLIGDGWEFVRMEGRIAIWRLRKTPLGYCGLAGKP